MGGRGWVLQVRGEIGAGRSSSGDCTSLRSGAMGGWGWVLQVCVEIGAGRSSSGDCTSLLWVAVDGFYWFLLTMGGDACFERARVHRELATNGPTPTPRLRNVGLAGR